MTGNVVANTRMAGAVRCFMESCGAIRALLLTGEESTVAAFREVCGELGMEAQRGPGMNEIAAHLDQQRYAAVIVDFDEPEVSQEHMAKLQQSRMNRNAVAIAIATNSKNLERALQCRAHFVLRRPLETVELRRTLRSAYDFMLSDHRRQFRCSIVLPVRLRLVRSGIAVECSTVNLSSNGVAVYGSMQLKQLDSVDVEIVLPDGFVVLATGIVVWDDKHGKCGIHFQVRTPEVRQKLDTWLAAQAASLARGELTYRDFSQILPHTAKATETHVEESSQT